jgi:hypothetical protein
MRVKNRERAMSERYQQGILDELFQGRNVAIVALASMG